MIDRTRRGSNRKSGHAAEYHAASMIRDDDRRHLRVGLAPVLALVAAVALAVTVLAQKPPAPVSGKPAPALAPQPPAVIVIPGARVLDAASGSYLPPATIVIEDGRIKSIGAEPPANLPASATTLKTDGGILVPGLIDAHAWAAPTADLDSDYSYLMGLAHGVTTYRVLNARTSWAVGQRARSQSGDHPGAAPGHQRPRHPAGRHARALAVRRAGRAGGRRGSPATGRRGVDWIAGDDNLGPDILKAMLAAAKDTPVRISAWPGASSLADLANLRVASIESLGFPLKPRAGTSDDAWLAAPAKDLIALRTRLLRSRAVLVPMLAAARMRAFPDEVIDSPALALLPEVRRAAITDQLKALLARRRHEGEARLGHPGGVRCPVRRAPADESQRDRGSNGGAIRRRASACTWSWLRWCGPGSAREDALRSATTNAADLMDLERKLASSHRASRPTSSSSRATRSSGSRTCRRSQPWSAAAKCSTPSASWLARRRRWRSGRDRP